MWDKFKLVLAEKKAVSCVFKLVCVGIKLEVSCVNLNKQILTYI